MCETTEVRSAPGKNNKPTATDLRGGRFIVGIAHNFTAISTREGTKYLTRMPDVTIRENRAHSE